MATSTAPPLGLGIKFNYGFGATASGIAYAALSGAVLTDWRLNQPPN